MAGLQLKYFVLKPEGNSPWAKASRTAMRVFAAEIENDNFQLAADLKQWAYEEERKLHREQTNEAARRDESLNPVE